MIVLACNNISLSFGVKTILGNVSFSLQESEKAGIVGVNGAGKSTLFKIISGVIQPDSGEVFISKEWKIGYLEQNSGLDSSKSLWEELMSVFSGLIEMEGRIKLLEDRISSESGNASLLESLMKQYSSLVENFSRSGGYEYVSRVKGVLRGLGFGENEFAKMIHTLSGGQKTRLALAKLLLEEPDILLLDEPTNHLDISAIEWLESFLKNYRKCVLLISHDRFFLDVITNKTIELENCECRTYNGNYSSYIELKKADREIQQKHFELQQKEIARLEAYIEQQRRWNRERNIIAAESRQKAIDRMDKIERPKDLPDKVRIKFRGSIISGNDVLFIENLEKEYPGKPLFKNINLRIKRSEKVFLLGPNGCGKSTLLKILSGRLQETSGSFEYGHKVKIGYYDQEHSELDESNSIIEEVWKSNEKLTQTEIRNSLASFLFKGEDVLRPVSTLSGGEKGRVSLLKLMLCGSNLLLLDEPTNHLDINSREVLEEALRDFDGTLLIVSHDRYFINKLATRIIELEGDSLLDFGGNYSFYMEHKSRIKKEASLEAPSAAPSQAKLERIATKEEKARQRRIEKQLADTETEIADTEARLKQIDTEMSSEEASSDHVLLIKLQEEKSGHETRLEELYDLWEQLSSEQSVE